MKKNIILFSLLLSSASTRSEDLATTSLDGIIKEKDNLDRNGKKYVRM